MVQEDIPNYTLNEDINEELNLKPIISFFKRNLRIITLSTSLGLLLGIVYIVVKKPIWEGNFQIVLTNRDSSKNKLSGLIGNTQGINLQTLLGGESNSATLKTEVEILKSPSVLMPIFEFVKEKKIENKQNVKKFFYVKWLKDHISVDLKRGTSVLEFTYQDKNKEIILPVLNKITKAYQLQSGKYRVRDLDLGIKYLDEQISSYLKLSEQSFVKAQRFSIENDLTPLQINEKENSENMNFQSSEMIRVKSANSIRLINEELKKLRESKENNYAASLFKVLPELKEDPLNLEIIKIDAKLANLRSQFKEKDPLVKSALLEKKELQNTLKEIIINTLEAKKSYEKSVIGSVSRPKEIIITYKQLLSEAIRDELTLKELQKQQRFLSLEKARLTDPWELITNPTIYYKPVSPIKPLVLIVFSVLGIIAGIIRSKYKESKEDLIYELKDLNDLISAKYNLNLSINDSKVTRDSLKSYFDNNLRNDKNLIGIYITSNLKDKKIKEFKKALNDIFPQITIEIASNIVELYKFKNRYILTSMNKLERKELVKIEKIIKLQDEKVDCLFVIND